MTESDHIEPIRSANTSLTAKARPAGWPVSALIGASTIAVFALDWLTPLGYAVWLMYLVPVLLTSQTRWRRMMNIVLPTVCTVLVVILFFLDSAGLDPAVAAFNRTLGIAVIWIAAILVMARKTTMESLRRREERIRLLVKSSNIGLWDWNLVTNQVYFSPEWKHQIGHTDDDLPNRFGEWESRVHPEDRDRTLAAITDFREGRLKDYDLEFRFRHKDGSWRWIFTRADLTRDEAGEAVRMMGCHVDITDLKRVEEDLRETRGHLESALAAGSVGTWVWDLGNNRAFADRYLSELFSIESDSEAEGGALDSFFESIHDEDRPLVQDAIERTIKSDEKYDVEFRVLPPDRKLRWLLGRGRIERDAAGNALRFFGMLMDITERKQTEAARRESDERYKTLFENAPDGIVTTDGEGRYLNANAAMCKMIGYTCDELLKMNAADIVVADEVSHIDSALKAIETGDGYHREWQFRRKDGSTFAAEVVATQMPDRNPMGMIRDISERKQTEEALRESEERFSTIFKAAPGSMMLFSLPDTILVDVNDQFTEITGYTRDQAIGKTTAELGMWVDPSARERFLASIKKSGTASNFEADVIHRSGRIRNVLVTGEIIPIGTQKYLLGVLHDVTELKAAEGELRTSRDRLRALSARLDSAREDEGTRIAREIHDELGGALTGLRWDIEGIEKDLSITKADSIASIREKLPLVTSLIDATIDTVRRISSELRPGLLDDLGLSAAIESQASQFQSRTGIRCKFMSNTDAADLGRDRATAVFRIFQEILTNVIRHAHAKKVAVRLRENKEYLELTAKDDGRGITDDEKNGTNSLGLLGMNERAVLVGGEVSITGAPGKGTTVVVRVPVGC